jgi:hypothetical protein
MKQFIIPVSYSVIIILLALTDALFYEGHKAISKAIEEVAHAVMFALPLVYARVWNLKVFGGGSYTINWRVVVLLALTYWFLRIALFDLSFNIFTALQISHIGTTDFWNNILSGVKIWQIMILRGGMFLLTFVMWLKWEK